MPSDRRNVDRELGAIAAFVRAVDDAVSDWVRGNKLRVDGILKTRADLVDVCVGYVPELLGDDYADHVEAQDAK